MSTSGLVNFLSTSFEAPWRYHLPAIHNLCLWGQLRARSTEFESKSPVMQWRRNLMIWVHKKLWLCMIIVIWSCSTSTWPWVVFRSILVLRSELESALIISLTWIYTNKTLEDQSTSIRMFRNFSQHWLKLNGFCVNATHALLHQESRWIHSSSPDRPTALLRCADYDSSFSSCKL